MRAVRRCVGAPTCCCQSVCRVSVCLQPLAVLDRRLSHELQTPPSNANTNTYTYTYTYTYTFTHTGKLLIHSPVQHTPQLAAALADIGDVGVIVAPNYEHVKYVSEWASCYTEVSA